VKTLVRGTDVFRDRTPELYEVLTREYNGRVAMRQSSLIHRSHAYMLFSPCGSRGLLVVYLREKGCLMCIGLLETVFHIASSPSRFQPG
jgi:hypothetical protein